MGFLLVALVIVASVVPHLPEVTDFQGGDKLTHFMAYAVMTLWFCLIYNGKRARWLIGLGFVIMGIGIEYVQLLSGYRTFEYADMGANTAGVLSALIFTRTRLAKNLAYHLNKILASLAPPWSIISIVIVLSIFVAILTGILIGLLL